MCRVLVVEDELSIRSFISLNIKKQGITVLEAETGEKALDLITRESIDIILLDLMLPGISGIEVCEHIRQYNSSIGIIMLTAKGQEQDKIIGLSSGADDYLVKPFSVGELIARIQSLWRRISAIKDTGQGMNQFEQQQRIILDLDEEVVKKDGETISLTPTEFLIMKYFYEYPNSLVTRDELLNFVWGKEYVGDYKVVDVNIRRLRQKLEENPSKPEHLQTVWGRGYIWKGESYESSSRLSIHVCHIFNALFNR
ncbi:response regulator transcription factor [Bacillus carboniphilus]|uniref:Response regulator transcription factor n=1 Tax=Bacillus carboniphilus TaxID=86663 RepID=A0ABY9JUS5_9BACI|nr:response regulator transcription factor [Bacillus carboniphilus]WLR43164.1 response regulator transcription factor [Bacillus carboniphilus]